MTLVYQALTALTALAGYAVLCAASPFGTCRRCGGEGKRHRRVLWVTRLVRCRRCRGTGLRLRYGRRLHNAWIRAYREANTTKNPAETEPKERRHAYPSA